MGSIEKIKPDFGNWISNSFIRNMRMVAAVSAVAAAVVAIFTDLNGLVTLFLVVAIGFMAFIIYSNICEGILKKDADMSNLPGKENYIDVEGYNGVMGQFHHLLLEKLEWDGNGELLDIGCGSAALTIRCAKKYPKAKLTGLDCWEPIFNYSKEQCEKNAKICGVGNQIDFVKGDAVKLDYEDEHFDAVISNFCFHEVRGTQEKRELVREALRVIKEGGAFAFQDHFGQKSYYGYIEELIYELKTEGISHIDYIPSVEKIGFLPGSLKAPWLFRGTGIICGIK